MFNMVVVWTSGSTSCNSVIQVNREENREMFSLQDALCIWRESLDLTSSLSFTEDQRSAWEEPLPTPKPNKKLFCGWVRTQVGNPKCGRPAKKWNTGMLPPCAAEVWEVHQPPSPDLQPQIFYQAFLLRDLAPYPSLFRCLVEDRNEIKRFYNWDYD